KRKIHVQKYNEAFSKLDFVTLPPDSKGNAWHLYLLRLNLDKLNCDRNTFAKELQEKGLGISMHFIPLFHFTYWKKLYPDFTPENFPNAQSQYSRTISLPLWPDMSDEMVSYVIECVTETGSAHHA
ncbi:MAG: DegT/DnrJ/EryC1/StrS family aminotransferase, partial [Treponema sp.]|nr:DegT/DnrJ/EryC1/StrS family aminotransferase [Treponema sp.]